VSAPVATGRVSRPGWDSRGVEALKTGLPVMPVIVENIASNTELLLRDCIPPCWCFGSVFGAMNLHRNQINLGFPSSAQKPQGVWLLISPLTVTTRSKMIPSRSCQMRRLSSQLTVDLNLINPSDLGSLGELSEQSYHTKHSTWELHPSMAVVWCNS